MNKRYRITPVSGVAMALKRKMPDDVKQFDKNANEETGSSFRAIFSEELAKDGATLDDFDRVMNAHRNEKAKVQAVNDKR